MDSTSPPPRSLRVLVLWLLAFLPVRAQAAPTDAGECVPPRTVVALLPLADRTDRTWALWSGESPALLVGRLLADSLRHDRGRQVLQLPLAPAGDPAHALRRAADDEQVLRAARLAGAEVAVSGAVEAFTRDDRREPGRLARWGVGAPAARSHVQVSVTLRMLDARDGSLIIETTAARDRAGHGTATASRLGRTTREPALDPLTEQVLREVLGDLVRTLGQRLDARWQARIALQVRGTYMLDAGSSRGLFTGQRLEVWRSGIDVLDEDLVHVGDEACVGALVVVALEGRGRARTRLVEGEAKVGDLARPCSESGSPAVALRR